MISGIEGKAVYLSGPITGMPDYNREMFGKVERLAFASGATHVYNPCKLAPKNPTSERPHSCYMLQTLHELTRHVNPPDSEPFYEVLLLLPEWWKSDGANRERMVALTCGIEIEEVSIDV